MSFIAPYMLWGALAAGIPLALHFFYRSRYRTVPWAAMKFLLTSIEQTSRRLRFQELLLLVLRIAVLILLAVALARPSSSSSSASGGGDAVDAVLVIDTSYSMMARDGAAPAGDPGTDLYLKALKQFAAPDGSVTRLDRARAAALATIGNLPAHSTIQVISSADRAVSLGPRVPSRLDQGRQIVQDLQANDLQTDFLPAVSEALAVLQRGQSPNKEFYLFSDMQQLGWELPGAALVEKLKEIRGLAAVHLVQCGARPILNASIIGITPQSQLRTGERAEFAVLVRNSGAEAIRNLTVSLEVDGRTEDRDSRPVEILNPGETQAIILTGLLDQPGRRLITARLERDDLDADNRFTQLISVRDQVEILVVDGAPNDRDPRKAASFYLRHALNPRAPQLATALPVTVVPADGQLSAKLLANKDLCILVNASVDNDALPDGFARALASFVQDGHGLMVFPGDRVDPAAYNRLFFEQLRLLPLKISGFADAPADRPLTFDRQSAEAHPFLKFRQDKGYASIDRVEVRRRLNLEEKTADTSDPLALTRVLLRYNDGGPAIVSKRRAGEGEVLLFTTSVHDPSWTDWFIDLSFVPFVQVSLNYLLEEQPLVYNKVAGEPLQWQPPRDSAEALFDLDKPDGSRERLGHAESVEGRPLLTATDTSQAGVYRIEPADGTPAAGRKGAVFAVVPDLRESEDLQSLKPAQMDERLGFRAVHLTAGDDGSAFSGAERFKREWTAGLLIVLFVLTLGEAVLAWLCGRAW